MTTQEIEPGLELTSKRAFAELLRRWHRESTEARIGPDGSYKGRALVWVVLGGRRFHLNGDSTRDGVGCYLDCVLDDGEDLPWYVVANRDGKVNKVHPGRAKIAIPGFYLYAAEEAAAPYEV